MAQGRGRGPVDKPLFADHLIIATTRSPACFASSSITRISRALLLDVQQKSGSQGTLATGRSFESPPLLEGASNERNFTRIPTAIILAGIAFSGFLLVNLVTAERSPVVWQDEVALVDPAVNLSQGNGFTSTAWWQTSDRFFASNAPLYPMLLYPWISLFGVNATAVRSLNYVLILGVIAVLWLGLRKLNLVQTIQARLCSRHSCFAATAWPFAIEADDTIAWGC